MLAMKTTLFRGIFAKALILCAIAAGACFAAADRAIPPVLRIKVTGMINPAMAQYTIRGIDEAERQDAQALIIQMYTPGGMDTSMRDIISRILSSRVPIIVYVAPDGARAASAGETAGRIREGVLIWAGLSPI